MSIVSPTTNDYRPGGKYYQSIIISFEGNDDCPPINHPYPPSEDLQKIAKRMPYFEALIEEMTRRQSDKVIAWQIIIILVCWVVLTIIILAI